MHNTNALVHWFSSLEGIKPFIENTPEHPDINYRNTPVQALYELRRLVQHLEALLPDIETPSLLLYADRDPVVSPQSAGTVYEKLGLTHKHLHPIKAGRHGILMENLGGTWSVIDDFLNQHRHDSTTTRKTSQPLPTKETTL